MVKIGGVSLDVSHPKAFSLAIQKEKLDMRYTHSCKMSFRNDEEFAWFTKTFDVIPVEKIEDMVDEVDVGFIQSCNWQKHLDLAAPFISKGKPVFIDKPIVGTVRDAKKLRELVVNGAKIYGGSGIRHAQEIRDFLSIPEETRGKIISIYGSSAVNEFDYGIHIVEAMQQLAGCKAKTNQFIAKNTVDGVPCETFCITFENGINGFYTTQLAKWMPFAMVVVTTTKVYTFGPNTRYYENLLTEVQSQIATGKSKLADIDSILNCCEIMICGKKSRDEKSGAIVSISDLNENDGFDGYDFEEKYAAKTAQAPKSVYSD